MDIWDDIDYGGSAVPVGDAGPQDGEEQPKPKPRRAPTHRKRQKLTLEHLEKPCGLQDVFENFPKWFADGYRGKGHEVRDLRRLLELYQRWQPRVFPHCTYNQFETALEKMSGTNALKAKLNEYRQGLVDRVDPRRETEEQQDQQEGDLHQQQQQQQEQQREEGEQAGQEPGVAAGGGGFAGFGDFDDDELLAMQAEAAMEAAEEAVPEAFEDFDEHVPAPPPPAAADAETTADKAVSTKVGSNMRTSNKRTMRDWSDDDDEEDIGYSTRPQQQRPAAAAAADSIGNAGQPRRGSSGANAGAAAGAAADTPRDVSDDDADLPVPPRQPAAGANLSRLQRRKGSAAAGEASGEEEELDIIADMEQQLVSGGAGVQQQRPVARRQMLLDDDSDDDGSGDNGNAVAAAEEQQQLDSQTHGTQGPQQRIGRLLPDTEQDEQDDGQLDLLLGTDLNDLLNEDADLDA